MFIQGLLWQVCCYSYYLADSDFHEHRPAVLSEQIPFMVSNECRLGVLTRRLVHSTAPVLLTKIGLQSVALHPTYC